MLETEYKELIAYVVPGERLVSETKAKMEAAAAVQTAPRKRLRTVLIAAVVLAGIIGASAIALTGAHVVDWSGNTLEGSSWKIVSQDDWDDETRSEHQLFRDTIDKAPKDEIWILEKDSCVSVPAVDKTFHSYKEMEAYIRASAPDLMLLETLPEGYDFVFGQILFYLSKDSWKAGVPLVSKETLPSGHILFKFKLPEDVFQSIKLYSMTFANKAEDALRIECERKTLSDNGFFPVEEGGSSEPVALPGMEEGIFIQNPESKPSTELNMRKSGMETKGFYDWHILPEFSGGASSASRIPPDFYQAAMYSVRATVFGKEELMKIAEGLK